MATNSVVMPVDHGEKAPLKKSTLIALGVAVLLVFIAGAAVSSKSKSAPPPPVKQAPIEAAEPRRGTGRDVADELRAALVDEAQKKPLVPDPTKTPPSATGSVPALPNGGPLPRGKPPVSPEDERAQALAERDSRGTVSKMVVKDDSKPSAPTAVDGHGQAGSVEAMMAALRTTPKDPSVLRQEALAEQLKLRQQIQGATGDPSSGPGVVGQRAAVVQSWLGNKMGNTSTLYPVNPTGRYVLTQGKTIPAVLLRAINTDLPCELSARTLVDVYDSRVGNALLIPRGSELVGKCSSDVWPGQERVLSAFQRLILPNGKSFDLPNAQAMDMSGASGFEASVNNHFFKMFASSFLVAVLSDRAERNSNTSRSPWDTNSRGASTAAGEVLVDVSKTILNRNKEIQPTLTVKAGQRFNVNVAADMDFLEPYKD